MVLPGRAVFTDVPACVVNDGIYVGPIVQRISRRYRLRQNWVATAAEFRSRAALGPGLGAGSGNWYPECRPREPLVAGFAGTFTFATADPRTVGD